MPETFADWIGGSAFQSAWLGDAPGAGITVWLLFTHIVLAIAVVRAYGWRLIRLATAAVVELVVSYQLYHACRNGLYCLGVPMTTWRMLDHIFVLNLFGCVGLHVLLWALSSRSGRVFDMVMGYLVPFVAVASVLIWPFTAASGIAMVCFIVVAAVARFIWWLACEPEPDPCCRNKRLKKLRRCHAYPVAWLVVALVCGCVGLALYFITDNTPHQNSTTGAILHGMWHLLSGIALLALTEATAYHLTRQLKPEGWKNGEDEGACRQC